MTEKKIKAKHYHGEKRPCLQYHAAFRLPDGRELWLSLGEEALIVPLGGGLFFRLLGGVLLFQELVVIVFGFLGLRLLGGPLGGLLAL